MPLFLGLNEEKYRCVVFQQTLLTGDTEATAAVKDLPQELPFCWGSRRPRKTTTVQDCSL